MSLERRVRRRQKHDASKMLRAARRFDSPHVLGSSQVEVLAALRELPRSPTHDDDLDPLQARKDKNARKRARKATR
jgi:hypothetical protein